MISILYSVSIKKINQPVIVQASYKKLIVGLRASSHIYASS